MNLQNNQFLFEQLVHQTIQLVQTEYPNGIRLSLSSETNSVITPKSIYPAFYGCYDWHSAVHSHWQIVKGMRQFPNASFVHDATCALNQSLTPENIAIEMEWVNARKNFEMPYGMAWLLTLFAELEAWGSEDALRWANALRPMADHARERFMHYCQAMPMANRGGLHNQSAFSLGLVWDVAQSQGDQELLDLVASTGRRFYWTDTHVNLAFEPSAADFLSPSLSEADLMARVLDGDEFEIWLDLFEPDGFDALSPVEVVDPSNGQLAHWAGLNFSRSWMLSNISEALSQDHPLADKLCENSKQHLKAALPMATHPDYMISHWVPTFAVYALTR